MRVSGRALLRERERLEREYTEELHSNRVDRRTFLRYSAWAASLFGVFGGSVLAGCAAPQPQQPAQPAASPAAKAADIVLNILEPSTGETDWDKLLITEYLKTQPGIRDAVMDIVPHADLKNKLILSLTAATGSYDLTRVDSQTVPALADGNLLANLKKEFAGITDPAYDWSDFADGALVSGQWKGEQFGAPQQANTYGFVYRKDLFKQAGLPAPEFFKFTWDEFEKACKALHNPDQKIYGYVSQRAKGTSSGPVDFGAVYFSWAPYPQNQLWHPETWEPLMSSPAGVEAMEYYIYLLKYMPPGGQGLDWATMNGIYQQGQSAMMINWVGAFSLAEDPKNSKVVGQNVVCTPPAGAKGQSAPFQGTWYYAISGNAPHKREAWKMIEFMTSKQGMKEYALLGGFSARKSLFNDPDINKARPFYSQIVNNIEAAAKARSWKPAMVQSAELWDVIDRNVSRANAKELTPKQAMEAMATESAKLLREWKLLKS